MIQSLLVDAGNSRLKWALLVNGQRSPQQASTYHRQGDQASGNVVATALKQLRVLLETHQPAQLILVHVLGEHFADSVQRLCESHQCELHIVRSTIKNANIQLAYKNPAHFGADRFVGLLAAQRLAAGKSVIIIDCGTAVTVDALAADGQHLGGLILPGLDLLGEALIRRTQASHMDATAWDTPDIFARGTVQGMGSGCIFTLVGAIEGICQRMQTAMVGEVVQIVCGGDAQRVYQHFLRPQDYRLEPEALMSGLQAVAEQT